MCSVAWFLLIVLVICIVFLIALMQRHNDLQDAYISLINERNLKEMELRNKI